MANSYFQFKQFLIHQDSCAMKVTTDACLFGAFAAEEIAQDSSSTNTNNRILDIGAGTGLLSLMIAQKTNHCEIDAVEIDPAAAAQAKENIAASPWASQLQTINTNIQLWQPGYLYDIVISNPPFYENELKSGNSEKDLAHHSSGLVLEELLAIIKKQLVVSGQFYILLPFKRYTEANELLTRYGLTIAQEVFVKQTVNHDPFRVMIQGINKDDNNAGKKSTTISIRDEHNVYTNEFTDLLKDFYLHL